MNIEDFINENVEYSGNFDYFITRQEVNDIADTKQDVLDLYTTLYGIGSYITDINYNNITTNKPDLSVYATNANLTTQLSGKQDTLTASTSLVGNGSAITSLNYNNITNPPDLSTKQNLLTSSSDISINSINANGIIRTSGLNIADANIVSSTLVRKINLVGQGAVMRIFRCNDGNNAPGVELIWKSGIPTSGTDYTYYWDFFIDPLTGSFCVRDRTTEQTRFLINAGGNIGVGKTPVSPYRLDVNGSINSTNLFINGTNISSVYLSVVGASFTYATISSLSSYLTTASASSTYATISSLSSYLTTASASRGFIK